MTQQRERQEHLAVWAEVRRHLEEALPEVAALMERKFSEVGGVPEPGSALDQCGLRDGVQVVRGYLASNECELALEHLCYTVEETDLPISLKTYAAMEAAGQALRMDIRVLRAIKEPLT